MTHSCFMPIGIRFSARICQQFNRGFGLQRRSRSHSIHILDDDSLINIFSLYRLALADEVQADGHCVHTLKEIELGHRHWWYKLVQVCHRWRLLVFGSASYLRVSHICTYGTPIADMLSHSPPLPLIVDYVGRSITTEDEEAILFALRHSDRVRLIRLHIHISNVYKIVAAMANEFPILEFLQILPPKITYHDHLIFPRTFKAPRLSHLILKQYALPLRLQILTAAVGIVTLKLEVQAVPLLAHGYSHNLLQSLSLIPQLEKLVIDFHHRDLDDHNEAQFLHAPAIPHAMLPKLRELGFGGTDTYAEILLPRITAPRLKKLKIVRRNRLRSPLPYLLHVVSPTEKLRFCKAKVSFYEERVVVTADLNNEVKMYCFCIHIVCHHFNQQVPSAVRLIGTLRKLFSVVECLVLENLQPEWDNSTSRDDWLDLLMLFNSVKTLHVYGGYGLVTGLSSALAVAGLEESRLPELKELSYSYKADSGYEFASFIHSRQNAGLPVALRHVSFVG